MEKGWEQAAAVLGVLTAGAAYVPIDPSLPEERIDLLLAGAKVRFALARRGCPIKWPRGVEGLAVDDEDAVGHLVAGRGDRIHAPSDSARRRADLRAVD